MKEVKMFPYTVIGDRAEEAAQYILDQEDRMISAGAGNEYFSDDYFENMKRFRQEAEKLFGVSIVWDLKI